MSEHDTDRLPYPLPMVEAASAALSEAAERHGMTFLSMYPTHFTLAVLRVALEPIRELHRPVPFTPTSRILECHGCDMGSYAEGRPDWPCHTAELVYTADEITAPSKPVTP